MRRTVLLGLLVALTLLSSCRGSSDADETPDAAASPVPESAPTAHAADVEVPSFPNDPLTPEQTPDSSPSTPATVEPSETEDPENAGAATPEPSPAVTTAELDRGDYRAAIEARDAGDHQRAAERFALVEDRGGALAPMSSLRRAQMLVASGREAEAADVFVGVVDAGDLPKTLRVVAQLEGAQALFASGRKADGHLLLDAVTTDPATTATDRATALWLAAAALREDGDPTWVDRALAALLPAPGSPASIAALDVLEAAGADQPTLAAAYVRYRSFDNAEAIGRYEALIDAGATGAAAPEAWFYLGALAERVPDNDAAIDAYTRSLELDPLGWLADDAHWWLGRLLEAAGRPVEAAAAYDDLTGSFALSPFAADAAFRAAIAYAREGDAVEAARRLREIVPVAAPAAAARASYWLAALGEATATDPRPVDLEPGSLWTLLDAAGADALTALPAAALSEWGAFTGSGSDADAWVVSFALPSGEPSAAEDAVVSLALELAEVGEAPVGRALLLAESGERHGDALALLDLAQLGAASGFHDVALVSAIRLLRPFGPLARLETPLAVEALAYPTPYEADVLAAAAAEGVPPLLLLALVRQESAFDPQAGSPAGASGLTQVIPATGAQIAASLGVAWDPALLLEPESSLRFGAHYLAQQLQNFEGDLFAALAAYNAGPVQARRWQEEQWYPGAAGYLLAIDFTETRLYLERVVENYAWYRYLYAGVELPSIR